VLDGWFEVTPSFLDDHRSALTPEDLKGFFDGTEPRWRHALAGPQQIPRRQVVVDGLNKLRQTSGERQPLVLLVGQDGQGKTTALLQMACDLVGEGYRVLMRSPGARLDPQSVLYLPTDSTWVLVSDDANEIAHEVATTVERLFNSGRHDVRWLLSARDVDWKAQFLQRSRTVEPAWARFADLFPELGNRMIGLALKAVEAGEVLAAWTAADCLGALAALPVGERAAIMEEQATKKHGLSDATVLGASLDLRYGAEGLSALVATAMSRLDGDPAQEAFLFAAAAQVAGVDGVDLFVLADLVGVDREDRHSRIVERLADAGLASSSAGAMRPRHPALARAALQLVAAGSFGAGLGDLYRRLVRGTAATGNEVKSLAAGGAIMTCGPLLAEKLSQIGIPLEHAGRVACAVGDEAETALPEFLLFTVARSRTYREAAHLAEGRQILRDHLTDALTKHDWDVAGRSFLHELSVPESEVGQLAEAVTLAGLALADSDGLDQLMMTDAKLALLALGMACRELGAVPGDEGALFRRQLRSCHHLGEKVTPKWDQKARFDFHTLAVAANEYEIPKTSAAEAILWLGETVQTAQAMVTDTGIADLARRLTPEGGALAYSHLERTIGLGRLPWAKE
jgi:hypothetical protein